MAKPQNQPNFTSFVTMLAGVLILFLLISQIGKHPLPVAPAAANDKSVNSSADTSQTVLMAQRARALVTIGAVPAKAESQTAAAAQTSAHISAVSAPAAAPAAPTLAAAPISSKATSAPERAVRLPNSRTVSQTETSVSVVAASPRHARYYQVRSGDTLFGIARKVYGDGAEWKRILQVNALRSPSAITVGQRLLIPAANAPQNCTAALRPGQKAQ